MNEGAKGSAHPELTGAEARRLLVGQRQRCECQGSG